MERIDRLSEILTYIWRNGKKTFTQNEVYIALESQITDLTKKQLKDDFKFFESKELFVSNEIIDDNLEFDEDELTKTKRSKKYRFSKDINYDIPKSPKSIIKFAKIVASLLYASKDEVAISYNITDIINSLNMSFISNIHREKLSNTISKILIKFDNKYKDTIGLDTLIHLKKLKNPMNIEIKSNESEYKISNVKLNQISLSTKKIGLSFNSMKIKIKDLKEIETITMEKIENIDKDIKDCLSILSEYKKKDIKPIKDFIDTYKDLREIEF